MGREKAAVSKDLLILENEALRLRLAEASEALANNGILTIAPVFEAGIERQQCVADFDFEAYHAFLEDLDEVVLELNYVGIILYCNQRFAQLMGFTTDQLIGLPFHRFILQETAAGSVNLFYSELVDKRRVDLRFVPDKDEIPITLRLTISVLPGTNANKRLFVVGSDISQLKLVEDELNQSRDTWGNRIAERTSKLARANEELVASRIATLSIMEDAVEAKNTLELTNKMLVGEINERKIAEEKLEEANEQLRALTARIVSVREEERTTLSREIHDELGSSLTGLKMDLMLIKRNISGNPDEQTIAYIMENITSMAKLIDSTIVKVRQIVTELRPEVLDELGLVEAIRWYAGEFQKRTEVPVQLTIFPRNFIMGKVQTTELFRIFQEVLTNVSRHSQASKVMVFLKKEKQQCTLRIKDNGIGIKEEDILRKNSFGLMGMRERTSLMRGTLKIAGIPKEGTTITIEIPVTEIDQ
jgi:PAS domain S-box-containing protein